MAKLERKFLAHYIDANMGMVENNYVRLGKDLEEYSEELNPQVSVARSLGGDAVVSFSGYETKSTVEHYYAEAGDPMFNNLSEIANKRLNDESCMTTKVDVLVDEKGNLIWAYREDCWIVPLSVGGDTSGVQIPFEVYCAGNRVYGEFDFETKEFTASDGSPGFGPAVQLNVFENGVYNAPPKVAYNPVVVNVQAEERDALTEFVTRTISNYYNSEISQIGSFAFADCSQLSLVEVPNCESIGIWAFYGCSNLSYVSFSKCTMVDYNTFANCSKLKTASFPVCQLVSNDAFWRCYELESVYFPVCTSIGNSAFSDCRMLSEASFPECSSIGGSAFRSCYELKYANFPKCTSVYTEAFAYCSKLSSINMSKCKYLGSDAFRSCWSLTAASLPECSYLSDRAFAYCSSLSEVYLPEAGTINQAVFDGCGILSINLPKASSIGYYAFRYCSKLVSVNIPAESVSFFYSAFHSCYALRDVSIPYLSAVASNMFRACSSLQSVSFPYCKSIWTGAFSNCVNLLSVYLLSTTMVSLRASAMAAFSNTPIYTSTASGDYCTIYVPSDLLSTYLADASWALISSRISAYAG